MTRKDGEDDDGDDSGAVGVDLGVGREAFLGAAELPGGGARRCATCIEAIRMMLIVMVKLILRDIILFADE